MRRNLLKTRKKDDTGCGVALLSLLAEDSCEVGLSCGCDEELWPNLTGRVDAFGEDEDSSVDSVLHGDDFALAVAECEVVVEEPAAELVGSHVFLVFDRILPKALGVRSPSAVSMARPRAATGRWASTSASACARAARSSLRVVASRMMMSGLAIMSSMVVGVAYMPCLRMEGRTSFVTQRRNALALLTLEPRIALYKPDSLMVVTSCVPPGVRTERVPFSSGSRRRVISDAIRYPRILATSDARNQGSPSSVMMVRMLVLS